jgi:hypothetical protein
MMPSVITIYPKTSRDGYGKGTFSGSGTAVRCRIQDAQNVSSGSDTRDVIETGVIYCYGTPTVTVDDKVVMPDSKVVKITAIDVVGDDEGLHHTIIRFGPG